MPDFALNTPVVFIIFNRLETAERVFAEIARAKPPVLLVVGDGPRLNRPGEEELVLRTRELIKRVDWPCEVKTNFSEANLGCGKRLSTGIDWVFDQVEQAIFLEDDCLPDQSFFRFCQELLEKYKNSENIAMISGDNFTGNNIPIEDSYYFSRYNHIWGWASWRRAWQKYDYRASNWPDFRKSKKLNEMFARKSEIRYWKNSFDKVYGGAIDTWDYQWVLASFTHKMVSIMPEKNLISNIGFGENATHTTGPSIFSKMETKSIEFPLRHPKSVEINRDADEFTANLHFRAQSFIERVINKIRSIAVGNK